MKRIILFVIIVGSFIVGCAPRYATTTVNTIDTRPTLSFKNVSETAVVLVDNINMGIASQYNGKPKVLVVEQGTHEVAIMENNKVIFRQTIFVESENKVINVH